MSEHGHIADGRGHWASADPMPKFGWVRMRVEDRGPGDYLTCEMCLSAQIRYEHHLMHREGHQLTVGCICSAHMTLEADHSTLPQATVRKAIDDAEEAEREIRALPAKVDRLVKTMRRDREELQRLMASLEGEHVPAAWAIVVRDVELPKMLRKAIRQEDKANRLAERFRDAGVAAWDCSVLRDDVQQASARAGRVVIEARKREDVTKLIASLDHPTWRRTPKGYRALTATQDTMQVFEARDGRWGAMYRLGAGDEVWGRFRYDDLETAKRAAIGAAIKGLVKAGRLPPKRPTYAPPTGGVSLGR